MKRNVFQGYWKSSNKQQFTKTLEALAGYISTHMDFPKDVTYIYRKLTKEDVNEPADLNETELKSETNKLIWKTNVQKYVRRVKTQEKIMKEFFP